jgi:hypothetical protein
MDLVASKLLQLVRIERLAECLLADQRPVGQFLLPVLEPRQHLAFEEAAQALDIGGGWFFVFSKFVWIAGERVSLGLAGNSMNGSSAPLARRLRIFCARPYPR